MPTNGAPKLSVHKNSLRDLHILLADDYFDHVKSIVEKNQKKVQAILTLFPESIIKREDWHCNYFTMDGSLRLPANTVAISDCSFFSSLDRIFADAAGIVFRGTRYLASIDPTLEVRQKLRILTEDFCDAVQFLKQESAINTIHERILYLSIIDYLKNSSITILNALIQPEKIGLFRAENLEYQRLRSKIIDLSMHSTRMYYSFMIDDREIFRESFLFVEEKGAGIIQEAVNSLRSDYIDGVFSSRYFIRPEASHPLVVLAAGLVAAQTLSEPVDLFIGLPAGATELLFAHQYIYEINSKLRVPVLLLPYSLHSKKEQFDNSRGRIPNAHKKYLNSFSKKIKNKNVLLIDDNSSTGRTLQSVADLLYAPRLRPKNLFISVAEADIVRTRLDIDSPTREYLATASAYKFSVNVLPVSSHVKKKADLRELQERRRLERFYAKLSRSAKNKSEIVKYNALLSVVKFPIDVVMKRITDTNSIRSFRYTFLSNFWIVNVIYEGQNYPSVEHAYQAQKFLLSDHVILSHSQIGYINNILASRGAAYEFSTLEKFFREKSLAAGHIKLVSDFLRKEGFVREDWDNIKVDIMVNLLLQKFEGDLSRRLAETAGKYLVEENTWSDTLWGVSNGRGRNLLGRMLMIIRDQILGEVNFEESFVNGA